MNNGSKLMNQFGWEMFDINLTHEQQQKAVEQISRTYGKRN